MKKKGLIIGIIIAIVAIVIVVGCVAIYIAKGFTQELAIKEEIQAIDQITNVTDLQTMNMEAIKQKTDSVVTTGDYAIVEQAVKQYIKDSTHKLSNADRLYLYHQIESLFQLDMINCLFKNILKGNTIYIFRISINN